jgi:hypothetical protein
MQNNAHHRTCIASETRLYVRLKQGVSAAHKSSFSQKEKGIAGSTEPSETVASQK